MSGRAARTIAYGALLACVVGCRRTEEAKRDPITTPSVAPHDAPPPEPSWDTAWLRLSRTQCYGPCPIYRVTLHGDGRVEYVGEQYVRVQGTENGRADVQAVHALFKRAWQAGFFGWEDKYSSPITDHPTAYVTFGAGGQSRTIEHYAPSEANAPKELFTIENDIDRLADIRRWTVCRDSKGAETRCTYKSPPQLPEPAGCTPPYFFDDAGMKRFKSHCL